MKNVDCMAVQGLLALQLETRFSTPLTSAINRSNRSSRRIRTRFRSHPQSNKALRRPDNDLQGVGNHAEPLTGDQRLIAATVVERTGMPGQFRMLADDAGVERRLHRLGKAAGDNTVEHFDDRRSVGPGIGDDEYPEAKRRDRLGRNHRTRVIRVGRNRRVDNVLSPDALDGRKCAVCGAAVSRNASPNGRGTRR